MLYRSYLWAPGVIFFMAIALTNIRLKFSSPTCLLALTLAALLAYQAADRLSSLSSSTRMWMDAEQKLSSHQAPGAYRILLNRGLAALASQDYQNARRYMESVILLKPEFDGGYWGLALLHMRQQRYAEGLQAIDQAIEINPSRTDLVALKARLLSHLGRNEEARVLMDQIKNSQDLFSLVHRTQETTKPQ